MFNTLQTEDMTKTQTFLEDLALEYVNRSDADLQAAAVDAATNPVERERVEAVIALRWHATRALYAACDHA